MPILPESPATGDSTELVSMHLIGFIPRLSLWSPIIPMGFQRGCHCHKAGVGEATERPAHWEDVFIQQTFPEDVPALKAPKV